MDVAEKKLPVTMTFTAREGQFPVLVMTDVRLNNTVEINIADTTSQKKDLAIAFARSFDNLNDDDIRIFTEFLNKRQHGGGENG